jgi:hypothetical protein
VMCPSRSSPVRASTALGKHGIICTKSGLWPHALKHARIPAMYDVEEKTTSSDGLSRTALPVKSAEMMGEMRSVECRVSQTHGSWTCEKADCGTGSSS